MLSFPLNFSKDILFKTFSYFAWHEIISLSKEPITKSFNLSVGQFIANQRSPLGFEAQYHMLHHAYHAKNPPSWNPFLIKGFNQEAYLRFKGLPARNRVAALSLFVKQGYKLNHWDKHFIVRGLTKTSFNWKYYALILYRVSVATNSREKLTEYLMTRVRKHQQNSRVIRVLRQINKVDVIEDAWLKLFDQPEQGKQWIEAYGQHANHEHTKSKDKVSKSVYGNREIFNEVKAQYISRLIQRNPYYPYIPRLLKDGLMVFWKDKTLSDWDMLKKLFEEDYEMSQMDVLRALESFFCFATSVQKKVILENIVKIFNFAYQESIRQYAVEVFQAILKHEPHEGKKFLNTITNYNAVLENNLYQWFLASTLPIIDNQFPGYILLLYFLIREKTQPEFKITLIHHYLSTGSYKRNLINLDKLAHVMIQEFNIFCKSPTYSRKLFESIEILYENMNQTQMESLNARFVSNREHMLTFIPRYFQLIKDLEIKKNLLRYMHYHVVSIQGINISGQSAYADEIKKSIKVLNDIIISLHYLEKEDRELFYCWVEFMISEVGKSGKTIDDVFETMLALADSSSQTQALIRQFHLMGVPLSPQRIKNLISHVPWSSTHMVNIAYILSDDSEVSYFLDDRTVWSQDHELETLSRNMYQHAPNSEPPMLYLYDSQGRVDKPQAKLIVEIMHKEDADEVPIDELAERFGKISLN